VPVREIYSHSRLSSFETCPRKFCYRYVQRIPSDVEGIEGFVGKRVHEVLERLYLFASRHGVPSLRRVVDRFHALWDEHFDAARIRIVRDLPVAHYRSFGAQCLENYYRRHYPFDRDETLGIEQLVTFGLDDSDAYRVRGIIDRVARARDGSIEIHDYKTSRRVPSQDELDRDRQLALYQMGIAERYGADRPVSLVWHYLVRGDRRVSTRTPEQLEALRTETIELIDRIRSERTFEPRPGPLCRWCEYNDRCPASPVRRPDADGDAGAPEAPLAAASGGQLPLL